MLLSEFQAEISPKFAQFLDWYVLPITNSDQGNILERSNWDAAIKQLESKNITYEILYVDQFDCEEIIIVPPNYKFFADELEAKIESYLILDEELFGQYELEELDEAWQSWGRRECANLIQTSFDCLDSTWRLLNRHLEMDDLKIFSDSGLDFRPFNVDTLSRDISRFVLDERFESQQLVAVLRRLRARR